jgi:hypothetical protein
MRRDVRADDGQLMLLAGVVLTISFILTALTLSQVASLERQAASEAPTAMVAEWRFLHERLKTNLETAVGVETSVGSLKDPLIPTIAATFRSVEAERGYDLVIRAAGGGHFEANGNEEQLIVGANYAATTYDGLVTFTHPAASDPDNADGVLWDDDCDLVLADAPPEGCIVGAYLFVRLSDGSTTLEESILFAVNQP